MNYLAALVIHPGSRWNPEVAKFGDDAPAQLRLTTSKRGAFRGLRLADFREEGEVNGETDCAFALHEALLQAELEFPCWF